MSMNSEHFRLMARFNAWVNRHLFAMVGKLSYDDYWQDKGLYFGSVHNTLNHILLVDRLWIARMKVRNPPPFASLAEELHCDLASLRVARTEFDAHIIRAVDAFDASALRQTVRFRPMAGDGEMALRRDFILLTLFNHQTHHRGQAHSVLTRTGFTPRGLDIVDYLEERDAKPATALKLRADPADAPRLSYAGLAEPKPGVKS